jgi:branched-subunit amino acid transport protein AzlD
VGGAALCILVTALVLGSHWWRHGPLAVLAVIVPTAVVVGLVRAVVLRRARSSR